jgi:HSP20 family protein
MSKEKKSTQEIQKAEPAHVMSPFEEMDRFFESRFPTGWLRSFNWPSPGWSELSAPFEGKTPKVDIIERDNEILVKAELPGVDKKDLDISVTKNSVTIKGSTSHEEKEEKGDVYRCEISRGSYSRTLPLPSEVDEDNTKAKFKDGLLELTLPKVEKSKRRKIEIE